MKKLDCLRCGTAMHFLKSEQIQLGQTGWIFGDLSNLLAGSLAVSIYVCPKCGKIEFFHSEEEIADAVPTPQKKCPVCGKLHDFDYPKCPFCKHTY